MWHNIRGISAEMGWNLENRLKLQRRSPKLDLAAQVTLQRPKLRRRSPNLEFAAQVTLERYQSVRMEIHWRGVQRDAMVIFAFTLMGVTLGSIGQVGLGVLVAAFPLAYLASMWLHHDRRIGSLAHYLRHVIEPAMEKYDKLQGLEEYLDEHETARSYTQRFHFTAIMSRLLFPGLQGSVLGAGLAVFINQGPFSPSLFGLVVVSSVIILATIALTFVKVKPVRIP